MNKENEMNVDKNVVDNQGADKGIDIDELESFSGGAGLDSTFKRKTTDISDSTKDKI